LLRSLRRLFSGLTDIQDIRFRIIRVEGWFLLNENFQRIDWSISGRSSTVIFLFMPTDNVFVQFKGCGELLGTD
uniref:Uncharacterized protein n=1 Tax=Phlebotomus papatasi TaxID=29031 RepID=A0A1B0DPN6_PHLPP